MSPRLVASTAVRRRAASALIALLAFACGGLVVAWRHEHERADCWREIAQEGVGPTDRCDR